MRDNDHHALASAGEEDAIGVDVVGLTLGLLDALPAAAAEGVLVPRGVGAAVAEVGIPGDAGPVEL